LTDRHIIPALAAQGHEVYAIDWIGCGLSEKPLDASTISFELHMATLRSFSHFQVHDSLVVAHDWGG
jgi:pimeloyl-ACP methyl ester carboxylesterase